MSTCASGATQPGAGTKEKRGRKEIILPATGFWTQLDMNLISFPSGLPVDRSAPIVFLFREQRRRLWGMLRPGLEAGKCIFWPRRDSLIMSPNELA